MVEAVPERIEIKRQVFAELDAATPGHAILSSNTSSLSITEMGDATLRPDKVIGFHYFYPASMMRLIEVVEGEETSDETVQTTINFAQQIRKMPIRCGEAPGLRREPDPELRRQRDLALQGRVGSVGAGHRQGDRRGAGHADGPVLPERPARPRHRAARRRAPAGVLRRALLRLARDAELVAAGNFGQKTGKGFYDHARTGADMEQATATRNQLRSSSASR